MKKEKMVYALQSMKAAQAILGLNVGSFFKRAIARLILMRIPDFIDFAQGYNNELKLTRFSTEHRKVKDDLKVLKELYTDYMEKLRHQFAGHFKDADFIERIEDWGKIEENSMVFFIRHAEELADQLILTHQMTITLDASEAMVIEKISAEHDLENVPRLGSDILALTRFNTGGMLHHGDIQVKPAMLNALRLILNYEFALLKALRQRELVMAFKTLVIVDIVSFADILFTRSLQPGAAQQMDGLDLVVAKYGIQDAVSLFDRAKTSTNMLRHIDQIRRVRSVICAHIDGTRTLPDLFTQLDGMNIKQLSGFYEHMNQLYRQICSTDMRLELAQLGNEPLRGVISVSHNPSTAYDKKSVSPTVFQVPEYDEPTMKLYWGKLLTAKDVEECVDYFSGAFMFSPELEEEPHERKISLGEHAQRTEYYYYRVVHRFVEHQLSANPGNPEHLKALHRIIISKNIGFSHVLTTILLKQYVHHPDKTSKTVMLDLLAHVSDQNEVDAIDLLKSESNSGDMEFSFVALHSLIQIDVRNNGVVLLNKGNVTRNDVSTFVLRRIGQLTVYRQIIFCLIALSYLQLNGRFAMYSSYSQERYCAPMEATLHKYIPRFLGKTRLLSQEIVELCRWMSSRNYIRTSLLIGDALMATNRPKARTFYEIIADERLYMVWSLDTLVISRALALEKLDRSDEALHTAHFLSSSKSIEKSYRYFGLEIAANGKLTDQFEYLAERLIDDFPLDAVDLTTLHQLRTRCYS